MATKNDIHIVVGTGRPTGVKADLLIIPVYEKGRLGVDVPAASQRALEQRMKDLKFTGAWGAADLMIAPASLKASFVAFAGLGDPKAAEYRQAEGLRRAIGRILQDARRHALREAVLALPENQHTPALAAAAAEAALLINYRFTEYRKSLKREQGQRSLRKLTLLVDRQQVEAARVAVAQAVTIIHGVTLARDLVNQPAAHASPKALVEAAQQIAKQNRSIILTVYDHKQAAARGFNAFLAVARGSVQEPYVIHLVYKPVHSTHRVALVGKGITFDSGGLSLKPAQYMTDMKIDMAGAAAVLGVFSVLPKLKVPVEVHGIIAACENMPSGNAFRPGDVLRAMNGKTIEVQNTDAEGRVTLADALSYAVKQPVEAVIDIATLTGASMIALGETHAGLWSTDDQLQATVLASAQTVGEGLVALPLPEEYMPFIQSTVADLTNAPANSPIGGAITAALFLKEFVGKKPWAHLDVASPVYFSKSILPYYGLGATGFGVRTLVKYLQSV